MVFRISNATSKKFCTKYGILLALLAQKFSSLHCQYVYEIKSCIFRRETTNICKCKIFSSSLWLLHGTDVKLIDKNYLLKADFISILQGVDTYHLYNSCHSTRAGLLPRCVVFHEMASGHAHETHVTAWTFNLSPFSIRTEPSC